MKIVGLKILKNMLKSMFSLILVSMPALGFVLCFDSDDDDDDNGAGGGIYYLTTTIDGVSCPALNCPVTIDS